jgi:hypothetical protein
MTDKADYPLITLAVTVSGEVTYSRRAMSEEQCEMVLSKMLAVQDRLTTIRATVEAERQYRATENAQQHNPRKQA